MIKATYRYLTDEARPRVRDIICGSEFVIAIVLGVVCGLYGDVFLSRETKVGDVLPGLLTYAAIALGFCVAGLTIALTLPDREFAKKLATASNGQNARNAYSDLLFVFSWTAICHWIAVVVFLCVGIFGSSSHAIVLPSSSALRRIVLAITVFVSTYGVLQFLITLITLSQVGKTYIRSLNER